MGCCYSNRSISSNRPTRKNHEFTTPLTVTRKLPQRKYNHQKSQYLQPVNEGDDTFMIFIKAQFGRTIRVFGLTEDTKISDVKRNIERNYGIPPSKLARGGLLGDTRDYDRRDTREEEIGFKNGTLNFPKDRTLKELNIKPNDVIFWTSFHDSYMKQIEFESIAENGATNTTETEDEGTAEDVQHKPVESTVEHAPSYSYETVVSLNHLFGDNGDEKTKALEAMGSCLEQRGFCFVEYPKDILDTLVGASQRISNVLDEIDLAEWPDPEWKNIFRSWGYFYLADYKQSIRVLTGEFWKKYNNEYHVKVREDIESIAQCLDVLCKKIIDVGFEAKSCWGNIEPNALEKEITLTDLAMKCGMIDFVKYLNSGRREDSTYQMIKTENMNVSAHTDPGLFSLNFLSTHTGLELYDLITKQWVAAPLDCGLLFCGETMPYVTDGRLKSAIHRVRFDGENNKPRFTAWYEVNATYQIEYETSQAMRDAH